jgi:carboxymethylenebutenolidase
MDIQTKHVSLSVSDGTTMQAYTAIPEGEGPFPGLIVFQEAFGVNSFMRNITDRFAREGFVAISPELFHRTAPAGFEGSYTDFPAIAPHFQGMTTEGSEADIRAAYDWLSANGKVKKDHICTTGYCLGGRMSFLANCILPFRSTVSYYGGGIAAQLAHRTSELHAPILFFWGGLDKHIPHEQIEEVVQALKKAEKPYMNVEISYADHGFFNDEKPAYSEKAAAEAWPLTLAFLRQ